MSILVQFPKKAKFLSLSFSFSISLSLWFSLGSNIFQARPFQQLTLLESVNVPALWLEMQVEWALNEKTNNKK